jgi:choline dehydrogenase-like flavoprotein
MRGRPDDYDQWNEILRGNNDGIGWAWKDVLPHFTRMEGNNRLANGLHSVDGPLQVSDPGHIDDMSRWFVQAVQSLGEPFNSDFNGPPQRGVGFYQFTNRIGKRSSAAYAFISPQLKNPRLTLKLGAQVDKIIIEDGRAVGVAYRDKTGLHVVRVNREVILAAGLWQHRNC